jgi:hypothetical protein
MAIKLRVNQATALTYKEMDRNFSSFFYSASIQNGDTLQLWYTGSSALNGSGENYEPYPVSIPLQPTDGDTPTLIVAGTEDGHIQIKSGNQLGYSSEFIYNSQGFLGVGTAAPSVKAHIKGNTNTPSILRLESINTVDNFNRKSVIQFNHGTRNYGIVGRDNYADNNLYIKTYADDRFGATQGSLIFNIGTSTNAGAWTTAGLGIGTLGPSRALHVEGQGYFRDEVSIGTGTITEKLLVNGNISTELQAGKIGFGVWDSYDVGSSVDAYAHYGLSKIVGANPVNLSGFFGLTFATTGEERMRIADSGYVGINTGTPAERLTVQGNISGSGNIKVNGNANIGTSATVGTSLTTGTSATVGTTLTVTGTATIGNIPAGTAGAGTKILTANNAGQIQYITGTFPLGGIVMWAGSPTALPTGWSLCNGEGEWSPGNPIPDLRERFIVGAGGDNLDVKTYNYNTLTINSSLPFVVAANGTVQSSYLNATFTKVNDTSMVTGNNTTTANLYTNTNEGSGQATVYTRQYALYSYVGNSSPTSYFLVYHQPLKTYVLYRGYVPADGTSIASATAYPYYILPPGSVAVLSQTGDTITHRPSANIIQWVANENGYSVGDKGGFNDITLHTSEMPSHNHPVQSYLDSSASGNNPTLANTNGNDEGTFGINTLLGTVATGGNQLHENRPPYYALAFIIYTGA